MQITDHVIFKDGSARIRGKEHIKAEMVARLYVDSTEYGIEDVMDHYGLTAAEVHATLTYYYDNQEELDAKFEQTQTWLRENATTPEQFRARAGRTQHDENK